MTPCVYIHIERGIKNRTCQIHITTTFVIIDESYERLYHDARWHDKLNLDVLNKYSYTTRLRETHKHILMNSYSFFEHIDKAFFLIKRSVNHNGEEMSHYWSRL